MCCCCCWSYCVLGLFLIAVGLFASTEKQRSRRESEGLEGGGDASLSRDASSDEVIERFVHVRVCACVCVCTCVCVHNTLFRTLFGGKNNRFNFFVVTLHLLHHKLQTFFSVPCCISLCISHVGVLCVCFHLCVFLQLPLHEQDPSRYYPMVPGSLSLLGDIEISRDSTVEDLKKTILTLPQVNGSYSLLSLTHPPCFFFSSSCATLLYCWCYSWQTKIFPSPACSG